MFSKSRPYGNSLQFEKGVITIQRRLFDDPKGADRNGECADQFALMLAGAGAVPNPEGTSADCAGRSDLFLTMPVDPFCN